MNYEIITSTLFDDWLKSLDNKNTARVLARLDRVEHGNFGDYKRLTEDIYELRLFFASGYRIYYTLQSNKIVILLCAGNKNTQKRDIKKAKELCKEWQDNL